MAGFPPISFAQKRGLLPLPAARGSRYSVYQWGGGLRCLFLPTDERLACAGPVYIRPERQRDTRPVVHQPTQSGRLVGGAERGYRAHQHGGCQRQSDPSAAGDPTGCLEYQHLVAHGAIVNNINAWRAVFPNGAFHSLGDLLSAPVLTVASPFLNPSASLSDEAYERIPQQILGLLKCDHTPRVVIIFRSDAQASAPLDLYERSLFVKRP